VAPAARRQAQVVDARRIDEATSELRDFRVDELGAIALGPPALVLSVVATQIQPALALPLFAGGLYLMARAVIAEVRRYNLVDRLSRDRDAYAIPEVAARGRRAAAMQNRRRMASSIRHAVTISSRLAPCAGVLESLAADLERDDLELDPVLAVDCQELVNEGIATTTAGADGGLAEVVWRVRHICSGFTDRDGD
jgi:hypothetical protein